MTAQSDRQVRYIITVTSITNQAYLSTMSVCNLEAAKVTTSNEKIAKKKEKHEAKSS